MPAGPRDVPPTPAVPTTDPAGGRFPALDGLRGAACLAIFVFHGWLYTMGEPSDTNRHGAADYAVHELRLALVSFFVLSGFLLYRPWVRAALGERPRPDLRAYVVSRVARIAPAYYAALLGSIVLLWGLRFTPGVRLPPVHELPLFLVFAQNLSPASVMKLDPPMWSLAVEVCFYALLPLAGWAALRLAARRRAQALLPVAVILAGVAFNAAIAGRGLGLVAAKSLPAMAPYFGLGMLVALLAHGRRVPRPGRRMLLVAGAALIAADAILKAGGPAGWFDPGQAFVIVRDLPSAGGFALIILALATAPRTARPGVLGSRAMVGMGTLSYGFYLWQVPVLLALRGHGLLPLDPWLGTLVAFGPTLVLAWASWALLERRAIAWAGRRNARARAEQAAARPLGQRRAPELGAAQV